MSIMEVHKDSGRVSVSEFADIVGVTQSAVSRAISSGRLEKSVTRLPNGRYEIDAKLGMQEFDENKRRGATNFTEDDREDTSPVGKLEAKLKHFQVELSRVKFETLSGTLISSEKVKRHAFKTARAVRDAMLNIPDRISAELAAEKDQFLVHKRLSDEIRQALESLAEMVSAFDKDDAEDEAEA